ncbi:MAG: STAS domain-containing protein [Ruminococcus sp.]|nr:STAS domain-containing protein [Ruminococcus sp.]MBR4022802.1 STAS domain-containing protein [Ruminococcus sp.]
MNIDIKSADGIAVASLCGEIDHHNAKEIRRELDSFILSNQPKELSIDFKDISFMDSSGIGLIIGRHKLITECGGKLIVKNPQLYIKRVLKLSGIERLVKITCDKL